MPWQHLWQHLCRPWPSHLEAGQLGIVAFGGSSGIRVLHALDAPWTQAATRATRGKVRFDADNTLVDTRCPRIF
jgi:hypothetical protein